LKHIFTPFPETILIREKPFLTLIRVIEAYTTIAIFKQKKATHFDFYFVERIKLGSYLKNLEF
jgi:hypothetical protein